MSDFSAAPITKPFSVAGVWLRWRGGTGRPGSSTAEIARQVGTSEQEIDRIISRNFECRFKREPMNWMNQHA